MFDCPDLAVPKEVMQHVVHVESSKNPFAIGVVGGYLAKQPRNLEEALASIKELKTEGYNFSVGIAQVNRYNLAKYGLSTYAEAFDVCANLRAGSRILRECYDRAQDWGKAFSCYYSGNFSTGFEHGYVQKIFASIRKAQFKASESQASVRIIPYNDNPRKRAKEDGLPLEAPVAAQSASRAVDTYPEPYAIRKYLPSTPLGAIAAAMANSQSNSNNVETAENRPAIPVPGPGAVMPPHVNPAPSGLSHIPTQVVGVNGDPYQTRIVLPSTTTPTAGLPANQLPLPNPDATTNTPASTRVSSNATESSASKSLSAKKGGTLLHSPESSAKSENNAIGNAANGVSPPLGGKPAPSDNSFVF